MTKRQLKFKELYDEVHRLARENPENRNAPSEAEFFARFGLTV